jgi:hypothetical protein
MRQTFVSGFLILGVLSTARGASAQAPAPSRPAPSRAAVRAGARLSATSPPGADRRAAAPPIPEAAPRALAVRFTLSPEWGYRTFRDHEPSSTDKSYTAAGVPGASARLELYPLAFVSPAVEGAKDIGLTGSYSRAFGLKSRDVDTDSDVDTDWYQFSFGLRYRILGGTNPLALGFTLGIQRSVFDFASTAPSRPIPIGRYTLLPVGADARYAWGAFSLFADGRFLLPLTVSPLGDRTPSGGRFGFNVALGAALAFWRFFEVELRGTYTLLSLSLPTVAGRADQPGNVIDQYLVFGAGATLRY